MEITNNTIVEHGRKFGYPECCIQLFVNNYKTRFWFESVSWYKTRTLHLNGYIPCKTCANKDRQILVDEINSKRKITLIS